jgi:hypothetical protein
MTTTELPEVHAPETARAGPVAWVITVDHKQIGLYLVTSLLFFLAGGVLAMLIRVELAAPGLQAMDEVTYNQIFTMHGTLMIYLFSVPIFTGLDSYLVPLQIGAADVAFPRLNALAFWLFLFGGLLVRRRPLAEQQPGVDHHLPTAVPQLPRAAPGLLRTARVRPAPRPGAPGDRAPHRPADQAASGMRQR